MGDPNVNWTAVIGSVLATGLVGYILRWASKGHDARASAESALIGMPGPIITTQNARIEALEKHTTQLWSDLQKAFQENRECHDQLTASNAQNERNTYEIENLKRDLADLRKHLDER